MKEADEIKIKQITDEDILGAYNQILEFNTKSYAEYIMELMIDSEKKIKMIYYKDKLKLIVNFIMYKYYSFMDNDRKSEELEEIFKIVKLFLKDFQNMLKEFSWLFNNGIYTPEEVADIYLYYFTLLTIHNNIFDIFDNELKRESIESLAISVIMPMDKTIDENIKNFDEVLKMVRKFKKEKEDK